MLTRRDVLHILGAGAGLALAIDPTSAAAAEVAPMPVIASFSILGDMVQEVGGERVQVTTLIGRDGDAHVYQPTPADARAVSGARVVFINGLGYEGWIERLIAAAGFRGPVVMASRGIVPQTMASASHEAETPHAGEEDATDRTAIDPHAWQNLAYGGIYVRNIAEALSAADPEGREVYLANAARYGAEIAALDAEAKASFADLPENRRIVVTPHDSFGYFGTAYGITFVAPVGLSTESQASAAAVANLIRQIRDNKIPAVFLENISDPRLLEQISRETGARIDGRLYSDALSAPGTPASTYLGMMRANIRALSSALAS